MREVKRSGVGLSKETFVLILVFLIEDCSHLYLEIDFVLLRVGVRT